MGQPDDASAQANVPRNLQELHFASDGLGGLLEQITVLAAEVVDADASAGLSIIRERHPVTVAASDERTTRLDEIQYGNGDGPCLESARTNQVISVEDVRAETRWPEAMAASRREGLRSSLSLPLNLRDSAVGALNMYMFQQHHIDKATRAELDEFATEASHVISIGLRHEDLRSEIEHLHAAMKSRRIIDQALGIIIAQNRCTSQQAFDILRRASQNRNVKIRDIAADIVALATGGVVDDDPRFVTDVRPHSSGSEA
jgi:transcriptional regulator with GAF, ATPase, and Fis domain